MVYTLDLMYGTIAQFRFEKYVKLYFFICYTPKCFLILSLKFQVLKTTRETVFNFACINDIFSLNRKISVVKRID